MLFSEVSEVLFHDHSPHHSLPMAKQNINAGSCGETKLLTLGVQEREREGVNNPHAFQGHIPVTKLPSTMPHLLKVLPYPRSTMDWEPSLSLMSLCGTFQNQAITGSMQFVEVSFDLLLLLSRYNLTCIL
jgi:hypothetical protein